ncbi:MAG: tetratricopeptide repeat protein [Oscillatoriales cyanobacterium SM2_2_1]|nr:tetratricopeptide repeat protein [Oscillatoriales cyanobacterium SM2_2_1]
MELRPVAELLAALKSDDDAVRTQATEELWQHWFMQKGVVGLEQLNRSQALLESGDTQAAQQLLNEVIRDQPDFVEAWNRRAVLYYSLGEYRRAIQDCRMVLKLAPYHFGAAHGMGLCHAALGSYLEAIKAFRIALEVQPHALINQKLILECTAMLT